MLRIKVLAALCFGLLFSCAPTESEGPASGDSWGQTSSALTTFTLPPMTWSGSTTYDYCATCLLPGQYACSNDSPSWKNGVQTFADPLPSGYVLVRAEAMLSGSMLEGPRTSFTAFLNEAQALTSPARLSRESCRPSPSARCDRLSPLFAINYNGIPGYVYGGINTLRVAIPPVNVYCASSVELVLTAMRISPVSVALGDQHSLIIKADGTVWASGQNQSGQLGDGTTANKTRFVPVLNLSNVLAVAAGRAHSLALKADGTLWAWGDNGYGQLGTGSASPSTTPVQVPLTEVVAIAAGALRSLAVKADGTVWAWGYQTGASPVQVPGLSGVTSVSGGFGHSLALKSDGTVWAWGDNENGQLGTGNATPSTTPVQVSNLAGVTAVSAGFWNSFAVKSDGTVWSWGANFQGQLGDGTTVNRYAPVQVLGLTGIKKIVAGRWHTLATSAGGSVWAWGDNNYGQLGTGGSGGPQPTPLLVSGLSEIQGIGAGFTHSMAVKSDDTLWAWGSNTYGQLAIGSTSSQITPVQVP